MRPARKGPENRDPDAPPTRTPTGFNEAGPQGAGKPRASRHATRAGPIASMRPARKGPENPTIRYLVGPDLLLLQ